MTPKSPKVRPTGDASPAANDVSEVDAFLALLKHPRKREILALRSIILGADPAISEGIKWNAPSFRTTEHFATFHLRGNPGVQIVLHFGAKPRSGTDARKTIVDRAELLEWRSTDRATVTFADLKDVRRKERAFTEIVRRWISFL
jgi:hypothetical protein